MEPTETPAESLPRYYVNAINLALGAFDATMTFMVVDPTALREDQEGPHQPTVKAEVQVVTPLGHLKSVIPILVRAITEYESKFGPIPAPGFEEDSKS